MTDIMKGILSPVGFLFVCFCGTLGHDDHGRRSGGEPPSWKTAKRFENVKSTECFKQFGGFCESGGPDHHVERFLEQVAPNLEDKSQKFLCPSEKYQNQPSKCFSECGGLCYHRHEAIGIAGRAVTVRYGDEAMFVGNCSTSCDPARNLRPLPLTLAGGASTVVYSSCDPAGCSCCGLACGNAPLCQQRGGACHPIEEECPGDSVDASGNALESLGLCSHPHVHTSYPPDDVTPTPVIASTETPILATTDEFSMIEPSTVEFSEIESSTAEPSTTPLSSATPFTGTPPTAAPTATPPGPCRCCIKCSGKCAYLGTQIRHGRSQLKRVIVSGSCRKTCLHAEHQAASADIMNMECSSNVCNCCGIHETYSNSLVVP